VGQKHWRLNVELPLRKDTGADDLYQQESAVKWRRLLFGDSNQQSRPQREALLHMYLEGCTRHGRVRRRRSRECCLG
jgi:hypothetical protein